jgi:hypothetical protein
LFYKLAILIENLHAIVRAIAHIQQTLGVDRDIVRHIELARLFTLPAPPLDKRAVPGKFHNAIIFAVAVGTTMGIMIANVPAVYLGRFVTKRIPLRLARLSAAAILFGLAAAAMLGFGGGILAD